MSNFQHPGAERLLWRNMSVSASIVAGDNYSVTPLRLITCLPGFSIFIQKITYAVSVETASDARVQSSNATPVIFAEISSPSTEGPFTFDFGDDGVQVVAGEHVNYANSAAGMALIVYVQAYMKPIGPLVAKGATMTTGYNVL